MLISIVMPCLNAEKTIARAINSIVNQKGEWELIIVDGLSTDLTIEEIKPFLNDSRIRVVVQHGKGIYDAINLGISQALGEWIGILNADDAYEADAFLAIKNTIVEDCDICYGSVKWIDTMRNLNIEIKSIPYSYWLTKGLQQMPTPHIGLFVKKTVYWKVGLYDVSFAISSDHEMCLKLATKKLKAKCISAIIANAYSGGVSAGILAKKESMNIAVKYGRNRFGAVFIFIIQIIKAWVYNNCGDFIRSKMRIKSRFNLIEVK